MTRNPVDWGLNVGHAQRENVPYTLPKAYQYTEQSILTKRGNTSGMEKHQ